MEVIAIKDGKIMDSIKSVYKYMLDKKMEKIEIDKDNNMIICYSSGDTWTLFEDELAYIKIVEKIPSDIKELFEVDGKIPESLKEMFE